MAAMGTRAADSDAMKKRRRATTRTKRPGAPKVSRRRGSSAGGLKTEVARLTRELGEALEQQIATADVLRIISNSPTDAQPVFDAIIESAVRMCDARFGAVFRLDRGLLHLVAHHNLTEEQLELLQRVYPMKPDPGQISGRAVLTGAAVQIPDILTDAAYPIPQGRKFGFRGLLAAPLLRGGRAIGAIVIYRIEPGRFAARQLALLQTFADQAVIAIENVRLFEAEQHRTRELTESLEQQTATAEVLRIISSSPGELEPVFEAILANATRICDANFGFMYRSVGDGFQTAALLGVSPEFAQAIAERAQREPLLRPGPLLPLGRVAATKQLVHVFDYAEEPAYKQRDPAAVRVVELAGARSVVAVPMLKDNALIGAIIIYRREVRPFTDKQIELVQNFAAQAVIAIENTRLLKELRQRTDDLTESLEQQTATSEVLRVISASPGELEPVFQAMLANAVRICDAKFGALYRCEDETFTPAALFGAPQAYAEFVWKRSSFRPAAGVSLDRLLRTKDVVRITDDAAEPAQSAPSRFGGARSLIVVPMLKENVLIGAIVIYRQEVRPFTDKQIELVKNFAAQAVIAIENTRLLNELRESLQQQTATTDVLKVISSSPGELEPVFQAMLENAVRICEAKFGTLYLRAGDAFRAAALHNAPPAFVEFWQRGPHRPGPSTVLSRVLRTKEVVHISDITADQAYTERDPLFIAAAELGGFRTVLAVPMLKETDVLGAIYIYRQEVRPFSNKQIALLASFAAQAVIAIENTRLLNELRQRTNDLTEALEQQTATSEVLSVISSSPGKLEPVFQAMLENATRICGAKYGIMYRHNNGEFEPAAMCGASREVADYLTERGKFRAPAASPLSELARTKQPINISDIASEQTFSSPRASKLGGARSFLSVPMLKDDELVGTINIYRQEVAPFTDKQIELLTNFAAQAVIAIENTRLLNELRQRTDDLSRSLNELRAAQDRLVQTEKLASLGQLTAGIAHEIKNPLNFVNNFSAVSVELIDELREALAGAQLDGKLRKEIGEIAETLQGNLDKVVQHGKRADAIVKNMLLHSRQGSGEQRSVDINTLVEESLNLAYHGARAEQQGFNVTLARSFDPAAGEADLFPQEITRVLLNLIANGFYAATKRKAEANGGDFEPTVTAATKNLGDSVEIRIHDNGTGIPPEVKEQMFNPFFTTKPAGEGTGLGLSISHDIIVKQHGGSIEVDTRPGEFTEFRIVLPRAGAPHVTSGEQA
jgi:two-component system, NtrC family, sensor kinase